MLEARDTVISKMDTVPDLLALSFQRGGRQVRGHPALGGDDMVEVSSGLCGPRGGTPNPDLGGREKR